MAKRPGSITPGGPASLSEASGSGNARVGWLFAGLFLLYMFDYIDREIVSAVFPLLKQDLGATDAQLGELKSAVYLSIVVFAFPISLLADRWSRKRSLGIMVMLWSLATGAAMFVKGFAQLRLTRLFVGVGEAGYSPAGTAMISAMYPAEKRARMMGLWNASIPLGAALASTLGGAIGMAYGWKAAMGIVAVPSLILGLLFFFLARDYKTVKLEKAATRTEAARKMRVGEIARSFLGRPSLLLTYVAFAGNTFLTSALLAWLPSYFNRTQGLAVNAAGFKTSTIMVLAIVGAPLGGFLVDAWRKKLTSARPLFAGLTSLLSAAIWFVAFSWLTGPVQYVAMMLGSVVALLYLSGAAAVTQDVVHPGLWGLSYGLCVIVQNALGSMTAPVVIGMVSDARGIATALQVVPAASVFAGVLFLLAAVFYRRDLEKVEKVHVEMEK